MTRPASPSSIVVGYDRTLAAQVALHTAAELAGDLSEALHVVHIADLADYPIDPDTWDWEQQAEQALAEERDTVSDLLHRYSLPWTYHARHGHPVQILTDTAEAEHARMIVIGAPEEGLTGGLQRFLSGGSVEHGLIRNAGRPVLVVPSGTQLRP